MASTLELLNAARLAFYDNKPSATLYQTATQSFTSGSFTAITFGAVLTDNWSGWSAGSSTRYTVQVAGYYRVSGVALLGTSGSTTGSRIARIAQNGTAINGSVGEQEGVVSAVTQACWTPLVIVSAAVGDFFELFYQQNSGATQNTNAANPTGSSMTVEFVHF